MAKASDESLVSAVNWSEVLQQSLRRQTDITGMLGEIFDLGGRVEPFTPTQAKIAARLWERTQRLGLSLADRACLALALERQIPVLTADRSWNTLGLDLEIRLIR